MENVRYREDSLFTYPERQKQKNVPGGILFVFLSLNSIETMYILSRCVSVRSLFITIVLTSGLSMCLPQTTSAQNAKNSVFFEVGGNGVFYSVNYDRLFTPEFSGRIGVMRSGGSVALTIIPVTGSYLVGPGPHKLELGFGLQLIDASIDSPDDEFSIFDEDATKLSGTGIVGYRYQPIDGGFRFTAGLTPIFGGFGALPWAGLSVGYTF